MSAPVFRAFMKANKITYRHLEELTGRSTGTVAGWITRTSTLQPEHEMLLWRSAAVLLATRIRPPVQACNQPATYEH